MKSHGRIRIGRARGATAIIVALALAVLVAFVGIGVDIGRLNLMDAIDSSGSSRIQIDDVRFSDALSSLKSDDNSNYLPASNASAASRYAMCVARASGIYPRLMKTLATIGIPVPDQSVAAIAVAPTAPSQCDSVPTGVCGPSNSLTVGQWLASTRDLIGYADPVCK